VVALVDVAYAGSLLGIVAGLVAGWRTGNVPAVVNSVAALAVALLSNLVEVLLDFGAVLWEFLELAARVVGDRVGASPVLEVYGLRDTALDLVFNAVGAVPVVALDVRTLGTVTPRSPLIANLVLTAAVVCIALRTSGMG
jgi:hypothetical protein